MGWSKLQVVQNLLIADSCIAIHSRQGYVLTKNISLFDTSFRHITLLFTMISRQDQNFRSIPRIKGSADFFFNQILARVLSVSNLLFVSLSICNKNIFKNIFSDLLTY